MKISRYIVLFRSVTGSLTRVSFPPKKRVIYDYWAYHDWTKRAILHKVLAVDMDGTHWACPLIQTKYTYLCGRDWRIGDPR